MGLGETDDKGLLPVPRRVNYNISSDPFYPRTDIQVYKFKKDGAMVLVPMNNLDKVGIITRPGDDPDGADDVDEWIDPAAGYFIFEHAGRYDVILSCSDGALTGRYSVWAQDPLGLDNGESGGNGGSNGGNNGGGIGIVWGN
jgi:hypothetical protein